MFGWVRRWEWDRLLAKHHEIGAKYVPLSMKVNELELQVKSLKETQKRHTETIQRLRQELRNKNLVQRE